MSPSYVYLNILYRPKHVDIKSKICICINFLIIKDVKVKKENPDLSLFAYSFSSIHRHVLTLLLV